MSVEDFEDLRAALDKKDPMRVLWFDDDPFCTAAKSECIQRAFNY